jgi:hypothetical protein
MVKRQLHVEGGGDSKSSFLASECRKAFSKLLEKAGVTNKPRVIVTEDWLLVDAEDVVSSGPPSTHGRTF